MSRQDELTSLSSAPVSQGSASLNKDGNDPALVSLWQRISFRLKAEFGDVVWKAWIKPLSAAALDNGCLYLLAETDFIKARIQSNYADRIRFVAGHEDNRIRMISVHLASQAPALNLSGSGQSSADSEPESVAAAPEPVSAPVQSPSVIAATETLDGVDSRYRFSNFVVGKPNELAYAIARRVAEHPDVAYNPLFLYSGVGLGKTHLMHAIAWEIHARHPHRKVMYLSAEKFMYRFIRALRYKDMMSFKEQFRSVDVLMIDDVQFISGKESTQEEFFHTFNALVEDGRQVILSADKSPTDLSGLEERLRSRLGWGMVADIHPADYELRLGILQARREQAGIHVSDKVLEFLAHRITSNIREIEGAFNRLVAHATLVGREITIESAHELLSDLLRANSRRVSVEDIQKQVSSHFSIRTSDMFSARRSRQIARPRQIAMYLAKNLTSLSYPEIGRRFGNRDHTTIMHAVRKIEELMSTDSALSEDISLLKSLLSEN